MKSLRISSCLLPEELITEILLKLPVKSLLRFKSVSHSWNSLITSPNFKNSDGFLLYWTKAAVFEEDDDSVYEHTDHMFIDYHAFSFFPDRRLENHRVAHYGWFPNSIRKIYGACKGVVCVLQAGDRLCLCNPYTKGFRQLPDFHPQFHGVVDFGFGVDPITDEFKVVLIRESGNLLHSVVWNSSYKCWRLFEQERVLSDPDAKYSRAIYANGFCYWMKYNRMTGSSVILAFDMSNDSFQEIKMPQQQIVTSLHEVELDLYNDYLAILTYTFEIVDIWLMEEKGCWRKVHTVVLPSKIDQVGVWKRNRIFASTGKGLMILYDPVSHCTTKIHVKTEDDRFTYYSPPMPYKETVVSV